MRQIIFPCVYALIGIWLGASAMADDLVRRASDMKDQTAKGVGDFARTKQYKRIKEWSLI